MARNSIRPLSVGNILSLGLSLYNSNRKSYVLVALRATAWTMVTLGSIFLILGLMVGAFIPVMLAPGNPPELINWGMFGLGFLLILPAIPLWIFCGAKYLYNEVIIARHAYLRLIEQPEDLRQTNLALRRQMWPIWLIRFLLVMILSVVSIVPSLFQQLPLLAGDNQVLLVICFGIFFISQVATWVVQLWLAAKLFLAEMALALEENVKPPKALNRSWTLTQGNVWRLILVLIVAYLILMPIYGLALLVPVVVLMAVLGPLFATGNSAEVASLLENSLGGIGLAIVLYCFMLLVTNVFAMPFWQTVKAAVYYDLRSRRDGLGLSLNEES
jgi:hypothetical protein